MAMTQLTNPPWASRGLPDPAHLCKQGTSAAGQIIFEASGGTGCYILMKMTFFFFLRRHFYVYKQPFLTNLVRQECSWVWTALYN